MPPISEAKHHTPKWRRRLFAAVGLLLLLSIIFSWWYVKNQSDISDTTDVTPQLVATSTSVRVSEAVFGYSVEGRPLKKYSFNSGNGDAKRVVFVGGIHGGYEWNSVALAEQAIAYFKATPPPEGVVVEIIPVLNPDGLAAVTTAERPSAENVTPDYASGLGRFNANGVDLNRNFDCKWQPESSWRGQAVSAGTGAGSEPEVAAFVDTILEGSRPTVVVFWHSQANNVYASECQNGVLSETITFMNLYANAAGYGAVETFDAYAVTGDAEGWLASQNIPAITVELAGRDSSEWDRNLEGINALLTGVANQKLE